VCVRVCECVRASVCACVRVYVCICVYIPDDIRWYPRTAAERRVCGWGGASAEMARDCDWRSPCVFVFVFACVFRRQLMKFLNIQL